MNDSIDAQIREHYDARRPDSARMRAWLDAAAQSACPANVAVTHPRRRRVSWTMRFIGAAAAAAILAMIGIFSDGPRDKDGDGAPDGWSLAVANAYATEMALTHDLPGEWGNSITSFDDVCRGVEGLPFCPVVPRCVQTEGMELLSACPCLIRGSEALHVRALDSEGRLCTLYQMPIPADGKLPNRCEVVVDGVRVEVWCEEGMLMGLARAGE